MLRAPTQHIVQLGFGTKTTTTSSAAAVTPSGKQQQQQHPRKTLLQRLRQQPQKLLKEETHETEFYFKQQQHSEVLFLATAITSNSELKKSKKKKEPCSYNFTAALRRNKKPKPAAAAATSTDDDDGSCRSINSNSSGTGSASSSNSLSNSCINNHNNTHYRNSKNSSHTSNNNNYIGNYNCKTSEQQAWKATETQQQQQQQQHQKQQHKHQQQTLQQLLINRPSDRHYPNIGGHHIMSPTSQAPTRTSLFDSCHRKIRLIGGGPVAFLGGLVAKARRKERDGDQNSTDTKLYLEESVLERKLPEADLKALVDLPAGLDYNEWLASHTLALFEHVNLVYGTISEFCTQSGCADMTGPGNRTYLWFDEKGKKTRVAAPQYIDYVMTFTQKTVSDESIFPTKYANEFPGSFESIARKILRLQFHVIAHLYAAHFREIALLGLHTHLNLTFAHLTALHRRFNLIDEKETDVLRDLEVALRLTDDTGGCQDASSSSSVHEHSSAAAAAASASGDLQHHQLQQQHHNSSSNSNSTSSAEALHVNSQSNNGSTSASASVSLIDGDAAAPPICTQPEAGAGCKPAGSSGLLGGILGDLTSGEFGDTTRYCTSAVPQAAAGAGGAATGAPDAAALNNGAGALHLNFSNNNNNNHNLNHLNHHHHNHHHHGHGHHGHHHHAAQQQAQQQQQHSGLIQCNAAGGGGGGGGGVVGGAGGATAAASSTTTA
ncbi:hypothetical protein KR032_003837 [Drosophila birchii]|nr:hypothetical protein KR032_003837 [Drosophila birchii]